MKVPAWAALYLLDPLERAGSTFGQQFLVLVLPTLSVGAALHYQDWGAAADTAGFAAILSLITSALTFGTPHLSPLRDLFWRVAKTGLQSFGGVLAADHMTHSVVHADWHAALATALGAAGMALLKGWAVGGFPGTAPGASALPWRLGVQPAYPVESPESGPVDRPHLSAALDPDLDFNAGYDPVTRQAAAWPQPPDTPGHSSAL